MLARPGIVGIRRTPVLVRSELRTARGLATFPELHPGLGAIDPVPVPLGSGLILEDLASKRRIHHVNVVAGTDPEIDMPEHLDHERLLLRRGDGYEISTNTMQHSLSSEVTCAVVHLTWMPCEDSTLLCDKFIIMPVHRVESDACPLFTD